VEVLLTHGASRFEACRPVAAEALRTALLPVLNQMSVVGLISIPGVSLLRPSNEQGSKEALTLGGLDDDGCDTGRRKCRTSCLSTGDVPLASTLAPWLSLPTLTHALSRQVIILYLISSSSSLAALFAVLAACSTMLDAHGRVRPERAWKAQRHGPMASLGALRDVVAPRRRTNVEA